MGPIIGLQFVHQVFNVEVNGGLGNRKLIGNLFVAIAIANEAEHLQLPGRKILFSEMFGEAGCHLRWNVSSSGVDRSDYIEQFILRHALEDVSRSSRSHRPLDLAIAV